MRKHESPYALNKYLLFFALVFIASVGPFWGLSRDFHDGTIGEWAYTTGHTEGLKYWLLTSNWWGHYALYAVCMFFADLTSWPVWIFIKIWLSLAIAGMCYEAYKLSRIYSFSKEQGIWVACLVATFPAFTALYSSAVMHFGFVWLGFLAHRWLFWKTGWHNAAAVLIALVAFQVNSLLVVLCALALVAWHLQKRNRRASISFALTVALAIAYYVLVAIVYPPTGEFVGYNKILWPINTENIRKIIAGFAMFGTWATVWLPASVLFVYLWLVTKVSKNSSTSTSSINSFSPTDGVLIGLFLVFASVFPYAVTGKGAPLFLVGAPLTNSAMWAMYASTGDTFHLTLNAFMIRQATTMAIPFAILSVASIRWALLKITAPTNSDKYFSYVAACLLLTQAVLFFSGHAQKWNLARWDATIVSALRTIAPPASGIVEIDLSPNRPYPYPTAESNHLLWMAYGRTHWDAAVYYRNDSTWKNLSLTDRSAYTQKIANKPDQATREYFLVDGYDANAARCHTQISIAVGTAGHTFMSKLRGLFDQEIRTARIDQLIETCKK